MGKHRGRDKWILLFERYEKNDWDWNEFYSTIKFADRNTVKGRGASFKLSNARKSFKVKYKKWKLLDNSFMEKKTETRGRKKKHDDTDIDSIINDLNDEQKREIIEHWIKEQRDKKDKAAESGKYSTLSISLKSRIWHLHRTTFYKKKKERLYKFDFLKERVTELHHKNKCIYGSRKISMLLDKEGIIISDRTLRNYMNRWYLSTHTRKARKVREQKDTNVKYEDLVNRNFNPKEDNIIATDVSYIPAKTKQNFVYLSVALSHKTKLVESYEISESNDCDLVIRTIDKLNRSGFILHSDHGSQYSSEYTLSKLSHKNYKVSMSRVGNSLDNREIEYFFGCLKGEYLNKLPTWKMSLEEIKEKISWYINWYNTERIQSRLQWKTPTEVSAYAI